MGLVKETSWSLSFMFKNRVSNPLLRFWYLICWRDHLRCLNMYIALQVSELFGHVPASVFVIAPGRLELNAGLQYYFVTISSVFMICSHKLKLSGYIELHQYENILDAYVIDKDLPCGFLDITKADGVSDYNNSEKVSTCGSIS